MKINEKRFPILAAIKNNRISDKIFDLLENSGYDQEGIKGIKPSFDFFKKRHLQLNYISTKIHEKLLDTSNFIKARSLLKNSPEMTGLILLPETILPDFKNVPEYVDINEKDYPLNGIFYSWLSINNHDKISGNYDDDEPWDDQDRELLIIPIHNERITQATKQFEMINNDEIYGWEYSESEGRAWYGKIHDYVMSFILFYNYTESEIQIIHGADSGKQKRIKIDQEKFLNESNNDIEIIDTTYFTKIIRTGEFNVTGHFRVQHYGPDNSQSKIIYVEKYKKSGYTRGAKIDRK